ncbi:MAG: ABC transporter ATP-binding protein [Gemmatimonadaceae bacterium]|nr:ABC transporter ATP-binding protein [Gemmatimonadaceae bacterium]
MNADVADALTLERLTKRFPTGGGVRAIDLRVQAGETVALLGPSGAGKSTLLRCVAGLLPLESGRVRVGGRDVTQAAPEARGIAIVVQELALAPHLSARESVAFGLEPRGIPRRERESRADVQLRAHGLGGIAHRRVDALSGGERQRVALLRALAVEPAVLLLDEPLAALDPATRRAWRDALQSVVRTSGVTTLLVTHDHADAFALADRVAVLCDGALVQVATPERLYVAPASDAVAAMIGDAVLLPATFDGTCVQLTLGGTTTALAPLVAPAARGACTAVLRPDALTLAVPSPGAPVGWPGVVIARRFAGATHRYRVAIAGGPELMVAHAGAPIADGSVVHVHACDGHVCVVCPPADDVLK